MSNIIRSVPRIIFHDGLPIQLIFFITGKCNLRCKHCFYADNLNQAKEELTLEQISKISKSMGPLLWLALTGGEPFLRKDISEIARIFYKNNRPSIISITTNGMLTKSIEQEVPKICQNIGKANLFVYVSIDGFEKTHNDIRGNDKSFSSALESIETVKKLKKKHKNLNIATVTTISSVNQDEIIELAYFIRDKIRPDNMTINMIRGKPKSTPLGNVDLKKYNEFIDIRESAKKEGKLKMNFGNMIISKKENLQKEIISEIFTKNHYVLPCQAGRISAVICETGDVYPCELLDMKMGNLHDADYNFRKIWKSKASKKIRSFIKDTRCYCTFECALTTNILFNPKQLTKMMFK